MEFLRTDLALKERKWDLSPINWSFETLNT